MARARPRHQPEAAEALGCRRSWTTVVDADHPLGPTNHTPGSLTKERKAELEASIHRLGRLTPLGLRHLRSLADRHPRALSALVGRLGALQGHAVQEVKAMMREAEGEAEGAGALRGLGGSAWGRPKDSLSFIAAT